MARRRAYVRWAPALAFILGCRLCLAAQPAAVLPADIAPGPLVQALRTFGRTTGVQVVYVSDVATGLDSRGVPAGLPIPEAVARLVEGTGLRFEFLNERTVRIFAAPAVTASEPPATRSGPPAEARPPHPHPPSLSDVVVTADRREEAMQHVPISIAAWTRNDLAAAGASDFAAVAVRTPGVEYDFYPDLGPGVHTNIAIRGIDARDGTATAVFLDDVPLRPDSTGTVGRALPLTADLERIEILRGPQGTLLGEAAEGGAIRFITTPPSLTERSGYAESRLATTERGGPSFRAGAAIGGPIVEQRLGFRVSGAYEVDGGFIDRVDPFSGGVVDRDSNRGLARSARLALTWAPNDQFLVTPSLTYQKRHAHDSPSFFEALSAPGQGLLRSGKLLWQPSDDEFSLIAAKATLTLGPVTLTSVTGHFHRSVQTVTDATNNGIDWGNPLGPEYPLSDQTYLYILNPVRQSQWTQELRLAPADPDRRLGWLAGVSLLHASYWGESINSPAVIHDGIQIAAQDLTTRSRESQRAVFGEVSWRWTEELTARAGLRLTRSGYDSTTPQNVTGADYVTLSGRESPTAYHLILSYQPSGDALYYATAATGYRVGGLNPPIQAWCSVAFSQAYGPDSVLSYEVGTKLRLLGGRARIEASAFHMRWRQLQTDLNAPVSHCFTYIDNVGAAASDGFELSAEALLSEAFRIGLAAAYTNARYSQTIYEGTMIRAREGDAIGSIPVVPSPWNLTAYADYDVRLGEQLHARLSGEDILHTRNPGPFYSLDPASPSYDPGKRPDPATSQVNIRLTFRWPSTDLGLFVDNVFDSQPTILRRDYYAGGSLFVATTFRPRTFGASSLWRF